MDWKRFAKKNLIPFYNAKDLVSKIQDHGFVDGVKQKLREDFIEDMPIIGHVYDFAKEEGRYAGKKEGYVQASNEYEKKLLKQAEEFLNQRNSLKINIEERDRLLDEYEKYIQQLENKCENLTRDQLIMLNQLRAMQNKLYTYGVHEDFKEEGIEKVQNIIETQFSKLAIKYSLTEEAGIVVSEILSEKLNPSILNDMLLSSNPEKYAYIIIENIIKSLVKDTSSPALEYDERGFVKNTAKHKNGTKYDDEGFDKYGYNVKGFKKDGYHKNGTKYDNNGFDINGYKKSSISNKKSSISNNIPASSSKYDERGFIKNTGKHKNGTKYDDEGFDKFGYDKYGNKKGSLSIGNETTSDASKYDERGFIKNTARHKNGTKYDDEGFDKFGYDRNGYDKNGLDKCGYAR